MRRPITAIAAFAIFATSALLALIAGVALFAVTAQAQTSGNLTPSGPLVINGVGQNGMVISGLKITSTTGDCVQILNSSNVTIKNSEIGPCGTNNSTSPSRGIYITGSTGISVYDNYIHVENMASDCRDSHHGIFITYSTGPVTIQGNVIAYNEDNIYAWDSSNISVIGNFLLNPRGATNCANPDALPGHSFQVWADDATPNSNITFSNNYLLNSHDTTKYLYPSNVSDSINFGVTNGITAKNNYVVGGDYVNGCGLIADYKANNALFTGNIISDTFNCGIGIISGSSIVSDNKVLVTIPGSSHAAGIMLMTYAGSTCGPVNLSNNLAFAQHGTSSSGVVTGYWSDGNCTGVTSTNNTFDVGCTPGGNCKAYAQLYPMSSTNPPPLIPPQPHGCVAISPYSTQKSVLSCSDVLGTLSVSGPNNVYSIGQVGGPFQLNTNRAPLTSLNYTLSNTGQASINFSVSAPSWLVASPQNGSLAAGASLNVSVTAGPLATGYSAGNYQSSINFTNTTNGTGSTSFLAALQVVIPEQARNPPDAYSGPEARRDREAGQGL